MIEDDICEDCYIQPICKLYDEIQEIRNRYITEIGEYLKTKKGVVGTNSDMHTTRCEYRRNSSVITGFVSGVKEIYVGSDHVDVRYEKHTLTYKQTE